MVNHDLDKAIEGLMTKYREGQYGADETHQALQFANWLKELKQYRLDWKNFFKKIEKK